MIAILVLIAAVVVALLNVWVSQSGGNDEPDTTKCVVPSHDDHKYLRSLGTKECRHHDWM